MKKLVISASRRTDIPAFYLKWFINVIKNGKITVQNPFYKKNYFQLNLSPANVEWIIFWSRNYSVFLKYPDFFDQYHLFFHFTVLSHHPLLEKKSISLNNALAQAEKLVKYYSPEQIIWRYDPVVIWNNDQKIETNFNENDFKFLCQNFAQLGIRQCYFSIVSYYKKFEKRFRKKYPYLKLDFNNIPLQNRILARMQALTKDHHIQLYSCCNDHLVSKSINKGSCISGQLLNRLSHNSAVSTAKAPTRKDCGCTRSIDIGNYLKQPCFFGCIYCYANPVC
jgi:hypothetical protein